MLEISESLNVNSADLFDRDSLKDKAELKAASKTDFGAILAKFRQKNPSCNTGDFSLAKQFYARQ